MKKNKILAVISIVCVIITLATVTLAVTSGLEEIKAYLNHDIKVYYNGELKRMYDVNGKEVFPVSYQGTTYVPIRAVSNMIGLNVDWDGATKSVLLGKTGVEKDFIENFTPYANDDPYYLVHRKFADGKTLKFGDKTFNHYIALENGYNKCLYYDLEGKYTTFTFTVFAKNDCTLQFFGDNQTLLASYQIKKNNLPVTYSFDVTGTQQLSFGTNQYLVYVVDAKIK